MALTGAILKAVWVDELDIANSEDLAVLLKTCDLPASLLDDSQTPVIQGLYDIDTQAALDGGVFGAPAYVIDGEVFWGQDRLDFVARRLQS